MAILRYAVQTNPNPAANAGLTTALIVKGEDYALKSIKRILASSDNNNHGDIGTAAGQTRDNAGGGAPGCLIVQFSGAIIKDVVSFEVFRPIVAGGRTFNRVLNNFSDGTAAHICNYEWALSDDKSALYIYDASNDAGTYLRGGDFIETLVVLGNV